MALNVITCNCWSSGEFGYVLPALIKSEYPLSELFNRDYLSTWFFTSTQTHAYDVQLITTYLSPVSAGIMAARPRIDCGRRGPRALRTAPRAPVAKNQLIGAVTWSPPNSRSSNQGAPFPSACGPTEGMTNDPTDLRDMNS